MTVRATIRERLVAHLDARGLSVEQVALRTGWDERTIERVVEGETFNPRTVDDIADKLRIDLMVDPVLEAQLQEVAAVLSTTAERLERGRMGQSGAKRGTGDNGCVSGWAQAAMVLGVSRWTVRRHRRAVGDLSRAWWESRGAVRDWYRALVRRSEVQ